MKRRNMLFAVAVDCSQLSLFSYYNDDAFLQLAFLCLKLDIYYIILYIIYYIIAAAERGGQKEDAREGLENGAWGGSL